MDVERGPSASVPSPASPDGIAVELTQACHDLNVRGLFQAAQWAAEQLVGLELHTSQQPGAGAWHHEQAHSHAAFSGRSPAAAAGPRADPDENHPQYLLARCYFQAKEYRRAAHALGGLAGPLPTFLRLYATYLAGEKRREEDRIERGGPLGRGADVVNPELEGLEAVLGELLLLQPGHQQQQQPEAVAAGGPQAHPQAPEAGTSGRQLQPQQQDPFLLYLYGEVLAARGRGQEALEALTLSLRAYPCNWSAWQAVQSVCSGASGGGAASACPPPPSASSFPAHHLPPHAAHAAGGAASALPLPPPAGLPVHWAREFFLAGAALSGQQNQEALSRLQGLAQVFRGSLAVEASVAQAHYNLQNFDEAQALYEDLLARDPYRIEGTDTFSNILFVKEAAPPLSVLAHRVAATDRYRPESCCVLGNYYSLQGSHERAVEYFRRALRLDPRCLAAWTLMGHEYMEVKNTPAAIDAYRRAIDVSPQDFRAWYGLGQAYELLKMPFYALYYYRRAAALRPTDARMWCALAQCYVHEQVGLTDAAIRAYQLAVQHNDPDGIAVHKLAKLYESRGELDSAERLFRHSLQRLEGNGPQALYSSDAIEALSFLAERCKDTGRLGEAEELCARLMDAGGPAKERAKALAREIRSLASYGREPGGGGGGGGPHKAGLGLGLGLGLGPGGGLTHAPMDADTPMGGTPAGRSPLVPRRPLGGALSFSRGGSIFAAAGGPGAHRGGAGLRSGGGGASASAAALAAEGGLLNLLGLSHLLEAAEAEAEAEAGGGGAGAAEAALEELVAAELGGCDPTAVLAVMQQLQFDRSGAVAALQRSGGDPVAAVRQYWYPPAEQPGEPGAALEDLDGAE
ncbi:hypothetical protein HXX76_007972 [Chlamydomonas incerta]|uniref:Cdc23 domain-containing protein n=1 Tax=Chlamydomonas incerta TaxID=51695 RepID=A0A835VYR4_CHLIN|nr:hypothetical protein HXX76_007972 [Chlamydomonas incerta]|eukprot:KAG2434247.1 hypothetical protein HXX76_007972 [Chlamydomonas incerta]